MSFCADPEKQGVCCPAQGAELLCQAWCSCATLEQVGEGPAYL